MHGDDRKRGGKGCCRVEKDAYIQSVWYGILRTASTVIVDGPTLNRANRNKKLLRFICNLI